MDGLGEHIQRLRAFEVVEFSVMFVSYLSLLTKLSLAQGHKYHSSILTIDRAIGQMFANGLRDRSSIQGRIIPKTHKMVLDTALLKTQHYTVRSKGKVEQSRE